MTRHSQPRPSLWSAGVLLAAMAAMAASAAVRAQSLGELGAARGFEHLSVEDGLSHPNVLSILQDRRGYLWFATYYGLGRYDGVRVTTFHHDPLDGTSLAESSISDLLEDREGALWVATWGGGLDRFDPLSETFSHHTADSSSPGRLHDNRIQSLLESRDGVLWVGTFAGGLARLDRTRGSFESFRHDPEDASSLGHDRVWDIAEDPDGRLWVATTEGLCRFDPATGTSEAFLHNPADAASLSSSLVRAVHVDGTGTLWAGTGHGLHRFDRTRETFERFLPLAGVPSSLSHGLVNTIVDDRAGGLWIGTGGGLNRYHPRTGTFERFLADPRDPRSLSNDRVGAIAEDRSSNLWIGTRGGGAAKLDLKPVKFRQVEHSADDPGSLSAGWVFGFAQDLEGRLWVATLGGLDRYDEATGDFVHFRSRPGDPGSLPSDQVRDLLVDREGDLWVATWRRGLSRLTGAREGFIHYRHRPEDPASLGSDVAEQLYEDSSGTLWVGTRSGLDRFDRESSSFEHFRHRAGDPHSLSDDYVQALYEDRRGTLWVGTDAGGLHRFDRQRRTFERFASEPANPATLGSPRIHAIAEDAAGRLWIGTANGLDRLLPDGTFRRYFEADGLPGNRVSSLLADADGGLWLSTFGGLSRLDPDGTFRNFSTQDGLRSQPFVRGSAFRDRQGRLYFGGENGFNVFAPGQLVDNPHPPPVVVTAVRLFDRPAALGGALAQRRPIELSWRDHVVTFEFAALDYTSPEDNRYRFKLEGFDRRWSEPGPRREARYTGLDPGRYTFRVQGSNDDGVWNREGASIAVAIRPPPWKTWWAYALYLLAASALVIGYLRWQQWRVERERAVSHRLRVVDRLKDEFLANTSHELRTPLYGMTGLAESLIGGVAGELPQAAKDNLSMIVASGHRLGTLVDDILDFSKLKHRSLTLERRGVDLRAAVEVVLALSRPLVGSKRLELENAVAPDLPAVDADENRLQQILYNLVGNAVKFTESGNVTVSAAVERDPGERDPVERDPGERDSGSAGGERLVVCVADTGPGIEEDMHERIFVPFEQTDGAMDREHGGTGLGLAVTRQLVELHGGEIRVASSPGQGARFFFSLPVAAARAPAATPADPAPVPILRPAEPMSREPASREPASREPAEPMTEPAAGAAAARVLIVDDEPVSRQVLENYLFDQGLDVTVAAGGREALRMLLARPFDLVLLDVMMPGMSGFEVCRVLRESRPRERLPVIFLTAKTQASDVVSGLSLGANDYLAKPISRSELLARVRPHLDLARVYRNLEQLVERKVAQIKVLRGLLPICASCKKIRDDEGYWSEVETFISSHSEARFSHGVCPACTEAYYGSRHSAAEPP